MAELEFEAKFFPVPKHINFSIVCVYVLCIRFASQAVDFGHTFQNAAKNKSALSLHTLV